MNTCEMGNELDTKQIMVMISDDHELVRSGIRQALHHAEDIFVVAEAADGLSTLAALETHDVDVLLLDIRMPRLDGMACLDRVISRWPDLVVLMLSVEEDRNVVLEALRRGAAGYISKSIRRTDLAAAIRQAAMGNVYLGGPGLVAAAASHREADFGLTARETEILGWITLGKTNQEIARHLHIAPKTVKSHLTNIFSKLGVSNRTQAASVALRKGLDS